MIKVGKISRIKRLYAIIASLTKYGFGGLVRELHVFPMFSFFRKALMPKAGRGLSVAERIRLVLIDLGPTFIKLGQVASTRADLLPYEWIEELKKLQDDVPPFEYSEVEKIIKRTTGATIEENYRSFDETPIASASIAQVHFAILKDGTEVAVKVRRPGIEETIDADVAVMYTVADLFIKYVPVAKRYRPLEVIREFSRVIHNELDLSVEGGNLTRFKKIFKDDEKVKVPEVYWKLTTTDILTMERIHGVPIDEVEAIEAMGYDIKEVAERGIQAFFKQVFEHGMFHGDLHPGNIFVGKQGEIIYLDLGIVGRLDRNLRRYLANMLFYLVKEDYRKMAIVHREMGLISKDVDIVHFEEALRDIAEPIFNRKLDEINISTFVMKLIMTAKKFQMKLQPDLLLLQKSMVIIEGVGRQLYPGINMWEVAKPLIYKWMIKEKASPKAILERSGESIEEIADATLSLPRQVNTTLDRLLREDLRIGFIHHKLDPLANEIDNAGKMVAYGFIVSSLILGSTIIGVFAGPEIPRYFGLPGFSIGGLGLAAFLYLKLWLITAKKSKIDIEEGFKKLDDYEG